MEKEKWKITEAVLVLGVISLPIGMKALFPMSAWTATSSQDQRHLSDSKLSPNKQKAPMNETHEGSHSLLHGNKEHLMITKVHPDYAIDFLNQAQDRIDALVKENAYLKAMLEEVSHERAI